MFEMLQDARTCKKHAGDLANQHPIVKLCPYTRT